MLYIRLSRIAASATVALMFVIIVSIQPQALTMGTGWVLASGIGGAVVMSLGTYRLFISVFLWFFAGSVFLRKRMMGTGFLEGTWVGHHTHQGKNYFTVEYFDQTSGETKIQGRELLSNGKPRAKWTSRAASIDVEHMQVVYTYTCEVFETNRVQEGIGVFLMIRESKAKAPNKLLGYSVEATDGERDPNSEYKIADGPVSDEVALERAKKLFCSGERAPDHLEERERA